MNVIEDIRLSITSGNHPSYKLFNRFSSANSLKFELLETVKISENIEDVFKISK